MAFTINMLEETEIGDTVCSFVLCKHIHKKKQLIEMHFINALLTLSFLIVVQVLKNVQALNKRRYFTTEIFLNLKNKQPYIMYGNLIGSLDQGSISHCSELYLDIIYNFLWQTLKSTEDQKALQLDIHRNVKTRIRSNAINDQRLRLTRSEFSHFSLNKVQP